MQQSQQRIQVGEMPLESVARHLMSGRTLRFECDGSNSAKQFRRLLYVVKYDAELAQENGGAGFQVACFAGSSLEYRLFAAEYETMKGLVALQPLDLKRFWFV